MSATYRIVDMRDVPAVTPDRFGQSDKLVIVELGDKSRHMVRVPADNLTPETISQAVRQVVKERGEFVGKDFTL